MSLLATRHSRIVDYLYRNPYTSLCIKSAKFKDQFFIHRANFAAGVAAWSTGPQWNSVSNSNQRTVGPDYLLPSGTDKPFTILISFPTAVTLIQVVSSEGVTASCITLRGGRIFDSSTLNLCQYKWYGNLEACTDFLSIIPVVPKCAVLITTSLPQLHSDQCPEFLIDRGLPLKLTHTRSYEPAVHHRRGTLVACLLQPPLIQTHTIASP
ncbi:hypothetical protein OG21DRAFT_1263074 [Imleria badia]|nr:hypothetical protein OG21DRAFT_1263074 [Imleria badia]